jgi:hypothetical protein
MSFSTVVVPANISVIPVDTRAIRKVLYLPTVSTNAGRFLLFKDYYGTATSSTFTISTTGTDLIDDYNFLYTMSNAWGSLSLVSDGLRSWRMMNLYNGALTPNIPFVPNQVVGLALWVDATDPYGNGTLPANNTVITSWADKSGSGNSLTGVNSPRWYASPSRMSNSANAYFTAAQPTSYNMIAFFVYLDANTPQGCAPVYSANDPATTDLTGWFPNCGGTTYIQTSAGWATQAATITDTTSNILSLQYSSASNTNNVLTYFNGTLNQTASSSALTRTSFTLGRRVNEYMTGNYYEALFYNTIPTTLERQQIEGYLAWKWGLQGNLPANHPYKSAPP